MEPYQIGQKNPSWEDYEQLEFSIPCKECGGEIFWGDPYYKLGDFVFCPRCLPKIAEILFHCNRLILGSEEI